MHDVKTADVGPNGTLWAKWWNHTSTHVNGTEDLRSSCRFWASVLHNSPRTIVAKLRKHSPGIARADAMATIDHAAIGGWFCDSNEEPSDISQVQWFYFVIHAGQLPWHANQDKQKEVATYEMLAQLVLFVARLPSLRGRNAHLSISQQTDSQCCTDVIDTWYARTPPLSTALKYLAALATREDCFVTMSHVPGKENVWADAISRWKVPLVDGLSQHRRVWPDWQRILWSDFSELIEGAR